MLILSLDLLQDSEQLVLKVSTQYQCDNVATHSVFHFSFTPPSAFAEIFNLIPSAVARIFQIYPFDNLDAHSVF